jgi:hypothetical protein
LGAQQITNKDSRPAAASTAEWMTLAQKEMIPWLRVFTAVVLLELLEITSKVSGFCFLWESSKH